jgi:hypothetical protein
MADSWVPVVVAIVAAVFGFIGVIIGGTVTGWFTIRAERVRADKAEAVDSARRRDDRLLDRDNFQRATLLALQDVSGALVTLAAEVFANDSAAFAKAGKWPIGRARAETTPRHLDARLTLRKLQSRVVDEEVRGLVEAMLASDAAVSAASDPESARRALADTQASERRLIARSGELILQAFRADDRPPS